MGDQGWLDWQMIDVLDNAIMSLRWCHEHPGDRHTADRLRELKLRLGYLGLALEWDEAGRFEHADRAIARAHGLRDPKYVKAKGEHWFSTFH